MNIIYFIRVIPTVITGAISCLVSPAFTMYRMEEGGFNFPPRSTSTLPVQMLACAREQLREGRRVGLGFETILGWVEPRFTNRLDKVQLKVDQSRYETLGDIALEEGHSQQAGDGESYFNQLPATSRAYIASVKAAAPKFVWPYEVSFID